MSDRNALADELEAHLHGLTHGEYYVPVQLIHKCIAALRATPTAEHAELIARLRANAQVCRDEQQRDLPADSKAELANNAREWDAAADRIEALAATEARSPQQAEVADSVIGEAICAYYREKAAPNEPDPREMTTESRRGWVEAAVYAAFAEVARLQRIAAKHTAAEAKADD